MIYTREVEKKYIVQGAGVSYESLKAGFYRFLPLADVLADSKSHDLYWKAPHVDFVRLRENSRELTVKVTDKGTVTDRIEENITVDDRSFEGGDPERFARLLWGPPCLKLVKRFFVANIKTFPAPGTEFNAIMCLYSVEGDPLERVFMEVEAESIAVVDEVVRKIERTMLENTLVQETRSLFQIFTEKKAA